MKRLTFFTWLVLLFSPLSFADDPVQSSYFGSVAIDGYDTVAYWTEEKAIEGNKKFSYEYKGLIGVLPLRKISICLKQIRKNTCQNTAVICAWAMSDDSLASVEGDAWTMFEGKLYLNYNQRVMKDWREQKARVCRAGERFL